VLLNAEAVATLLSLLVHVPPATKFEREVEAPMHIDGTPPILLGRELTVTAFIA
jgi:hypothetical protein